MKTRGNCKKTTQRPTTKIDLKGFDHFDRPKMKPRSNFFLFICLLLLNKYKNFMAGNK